MMSWFGPAPFGPICETNPRIDIPVGMLCAWCDERITQHQSGFLYPYVAATHKECMIRQVLGGINHQKHQCTCCGGTVPPDPEGVTRRRAAILAYEFALQVRSRSLL